MNFAKNCIALCIIGAFYNLSAVGSNDLPLQQKGAESILESYGVDKKTQVEIAKSYQEVKRLEESILKHRHNIEVHKEAIIVSSDPKYKKRDRTDELKKKVAKELKESDFGASRMLQDRDPKVLKIWNKMLEDEKKEIYRIAEERVQENEYRNMAICIASRALYKNQTADHVKSIWKKELVRKLGVSEQDAEELIENKDPRAEIIFKDAAQAEDIRIYNQAKIQVLEKERQYEELNKKTSKGKK